MLEALIEKQSLAQLLSFLILAVKHVSVEATDILIRYLLIHDLLDVFEGLFIGCSHLLGYLRRLEVINFGLQLSVVFDDLLDDLCFCNLSIWVLASKVSIVWFVGVHIYISCIIQFILANISDVVSRFGEASTIRFLIDLALFHDTDPMVIIATPYALLVILNVAIVVA